MTTNEIEKEVPSEQGTHERHLRRRGVDLGIIHINSIVESSSFNSLLNARKEWQQGKSILLSGFCKDQLDFYQHDILQSHKLYEAVLAAEQECDEILANTPYASRLETNFESLGSSVNEGDDQEIETVLFDALNNGKIVAEDLWMKASWLSFHEEDASLRFRFSFGVDLHEDVAADENRQHYASLLTDAVFPESQLITKHDDLNRGIKNILGAENIHFVERIVYFNSPNGGAYLHHDRERGHAGVIFAQITGETFWLALPKKQLMQELTAFVEACVFNENWPDNLNDMAKRELFELINNQKALSDELETFSNNVLIQTMNETQAFIQYLIKQGHGKYLVPGDVLLLPQETEMDCCWHSVFCAGEKAGQALSFAVRAD